MRIFLIFLLLQLGHCAQDIKGSIYNRLTSSVFRAGSSFHFEDLKPVVNPNPFPEPQPEILRPEFIESDLSIGKAWVTLGGTASRPGNQISVLDLNSLHEIKRVTVGLKPIHIVLHPSKLWVFVTNEYSNYISVIDTRTDKLVSRIPADFYCQSMLILPDGKRAYLTNLYLSQVLPLDLNTNSGIPRGSLLKSPGFSKADFINGDPSVHSILRNRCQKCHNQSAGGFVVSKDQNLSFMSAIENSVPSKPDQSVLLRAVLPVSQGGFGNNKTGGEFHAGGVLMENHEEEYKTVARWIQNSKDGPGIIVGNPQSMPRRMVITKDRKHLIVNNLGTNDLSVIDLNTHQDIGGIYLQGLAHSITELIHPGTGEQSLLVLGLGAGFGAPKSRDPLGSETLDKENPAAHFTVLRDKHNTDALEIDKQFVMGPFDAVDGTWNFKMRDIQNDLVLIDLEKVQFPRFKHEELKYFLMANTYEDHPHWVRYTSDTAEATHGDIKADYPPELQRVHGSFPDAALQIDNRLYLTMRSSFEVVEYAIHWNPKENYQKLSPQRVFATGLMPSGIARGLKNTLLVLNSYQDSLQVIDLESGLSRTVYAFGAQQDTMITDAAKGDLIFHSSKLTSDGDTSCFHCHYRSTGDGRPWGAAEAISQFRNGHFESGGTLGIPQVRSLYGNEPFYFEGTHLFSEGQGADINEPASSIDFEKRVYGGDYRHIKHPLPEDKRPLMHEELKERVEVHKLGTIWWDLEERRNTFLKEKTQEIFGKSYGLHDLYRFMGTFMSNDTYLPPNPYDRQQTTFLRGKDLFFSAQVMCAVCHSPPNCTSKSPLLAPNDRRALPQLTTVSRRDASYTLVSVNALERINQKFTDMGVNDPGRVEDVEGSFTTMQLRGIFDRPPVFLHHGRAKSLREVLLSPGHAGAKKYNYPVFLGTENVRPDRKEKGFNETTLRVQTGLLDPDTQVVDTHGGTSHLSSRQIDDLLNFMLGIP